MVFMEPSGSAKLGAVRSALPTRRPTISWQRPATATGLALDGRPDDNQRLTRACVVDSGRAARPRRWRSSRPSLQGYTLIVFPCSCSSQRLRAWTDAPFGVTLPAASLVVLRRAVCITYQALISSASKFRAEDMSKS